MTKQIYILLGASGSGKSTFAKHLKKWGIRELVSTTTRRARLGEAQGIDYYFTTREAWTLLEFIECTEYAGYKYGLEKDEVDAKLEFHDKVFAVMDMTGVNAMRRLYGDAVKVIYVYAPIAELKARLIKDRGRDAAMERLAHASDTMEYSNIYHADYVIMNRDGQQADSIGLLRHIVGEEY